MEVNIYRVMQERRHMTVDMDKCLQFSYERENIGEFLSKKEALRLAQRVFARAGGYSWVTVNKDRISDKGRSYGVRVYNLYKSK